jgi:hypothetical protein
MVWEAETGRELLRLPHTADVLSAQFSTDGQRIVTTSLDGAARLWDANTGQSLTEPLRHGGTLWHARFSGDGLHLATASDDKTARLWDTIMGMPLGDPLPHSREVFFTQFSPNGQWLLTASRDQKVRVWETPLASGPAPSWLGELGEALAGLRMKERKETETVSIAALLRIKRELAGNSGADPYGRFAHWFFADRSTRAISPNSPVTVPTCVRQRIEENTLDSLQEAVRLAPTNGTALARLAVQVLAQDPARNPRQAGEADFYSRRALDLQPDDDTVRTIRAEILQRLHPAVK